MSTTNLPLIAIRAFQSVYQSGVNRSAARELTIAHSTVSRHVGYLEQLTCVPLLDRESAGRALRFTVYSETLGLATIESLNLLSTSIASVKGGRGNLTVISNTPSFESRWLLPRIVAFNAEFPWIEISVVAE
ncbi:MAG: LysR family transcriptional regulator [Rhizobiaceae bacterium]